MQLVSHSDATIGSSPIPLFEGGRGKGECVTSSKGTFIGGYN